MPFPFSTFSANPNMLSSVFIVSAPFFFIVTDRFRTASIRAPFAAWKRSLTWAFTSFSFAIFGSCMKAPPRVFGGWSPVVAYLRHSMTVVFPLPLWPTMTVTGEKNSMTDMFLSSNDRIPRIASLLRCAMTKREKGGGSKGSLHPRRHCSRRSRRRLSQGD